MCDLSMQNLHSLHLRERQHLEIASLPVEILAHIFTHLDFPSLRAVRLTSETFYSVTKTRQFWYHRVNNLIKVHHVSLLEEEPDKYTVDELEQWTFRRSRALDFEGLSELNHWNFKLIPGGRWLLISRLSAALYYLDLDCVDLTPRLLLDVKEIDVEVRTARLTHFAIWIDRGTPRLSVRLALLAKAKDISRICVGRVDLVGHGADATLVASNITTFRNLDSYVRYARTALNDRYLVQVWHDESIKSRIVVCDYRQALEGSGDCMDHGNVHCSDVGTPRIVQFIYNDILAIECCDSFSLSLLEVGPATSFKVLHRIDMLGGPCSTPHWTPGASFITMTNDDWRGDLQGLVIPHDSSHPPLILALGTCSTRAFHYILGTRVIVALDRVFSLDWDLNSPTHLPLTIKHVCQEEFSSHFITFEEDIGRFLCYPSRLHLDIFDVV